MPVGLPMNPETIRKYSIWFLIYGLALIVLGALGIIAPGVATLAVEAMIAWLLLIGGVFGVIASLSAGTSSPGFWWNLLTAVLFVLAGISLLWDPIAGALTLTIILAAYLLAAGIVKIVAALDYRQHIPRAWGWMLFSAIIDIVLGVLIFLGLPFTAAWILGLFVGINLLFTGVALVAGAIHFRREAPTATTGTPQSAGA